MKLSTILDQLKVGELSQLALTEEGPNGLLEKNKQDLVTHINMALNAIHKRFVLKRETLRVRLQPGLDIYVMSRDHAESNTASTAVKYIEDLAHPYSGNLLQIEAISDDMGNIVPFNIGNRPDAVISINHNTFKLPAKERTLPGRRHITERTEYLEVTVRTGHRELGMMDMAYPPDMVEVDLPETHLEPLLYYIASRVMNPIGLSESYEFHAGNNYAAKYEAACLQIQHEGYELSDPGLENTFTRDGWV